MVGDNLFRDIQGNQTAGYHHGFLVRRDGAFFDFNPALARGVGMDLGRCTTIGGLTELFSHLRGVAYVARFQQAASLVDD